MSKTDDSEKVLSEPTSAYIEAETRLSSYINSKRLRKTPERFAILREVLAMKSHFAIHDLQEAMDRSGYHVSRATVYNTVELLCDAGITRKHFIEARQAYYECETSNHLHLVCTGCGKIKEVDHPELSRLLITMKYPAFRASYFSASLYGFCSSCLRKEKKKQEANTGARTRKRKP